MNTPRPLPLLLLAFLAVAAATVRGAGAQAPPGTAAPTAPPSEAAIRAAYAAQDTLRLAAPPGTPAHAAAAHAAALAAAQVAYLRRATGSAAETDTWDKRAQTLYAEAIVDMQTVAAATPNGSDARTEALRRTSMLADEAAQVLAALGHDATASADAAEALQWQQDAYSNAFRYEQTTPPGTEERAQAAGKAGVLATNIAWRLFAQNRFPEATAWFQTFSTRDGESTDSKKAALTATLARHDAEIKDFHAALVVETDEAKKSSLSTKIWVWRTFESSVCLGSLYLMAQRQHDWAAMLQYAQKMILASQDAADVYSSVARLFTAASEKAALTPHPDAASLALIMGTPNLNAYFVNDAQVSVARAYEYAGDSQKGLGLYEDAKESYQKALQIRTSLPPDFVNAQVDVTQVDLGDLAEDQGDIEGARHWYKETLKTLDRAQPVWQQALRSPRPVRYATSDPADAARQWENEKNKIQSNALAGRYHALYALGTLAESDENDYRTALDTFQQALDALKGYPRDQQSEAERQILVVQCLEQIALADMFSGQTDQALQEFLSLLRSQASTASQWGGDPVFGFLEQPGRAIISLTMIAHILDQQDDFPDALRFAEQARQIGLADHDIFGVIDCDLVLTSTALDAGDTGKADTYATEALTLARSQKERLSIANIESTLANVRLHQNRLVEAKALIAESGQTDQDKGTLNARSGRLYTQGRIQEATGDKAGALASYQQSIRLSEAIRSTSPSASGYAALKENARVYEAIVSLLLRSGRNGEAFDYLQRSRSRKMQDALHLYSVKTNNPRLQSPLDQYRLADSRMRLLGVQIQNPENQSLPAKLALLSRLETQAESDRADARRRLRGLNANYERILAVQPTPLLAGQKYIPADTLLIEYAFLHQKLVIFAVTKTGVHVVPTTVKIADLKQQVRTFLGLMQQAKRDWQHGKTAPIGDWMSADPSVTSLRANVTTLYGMLIAPIAPEMTGRRVLAFLPTDFLYYLPFQALAHQQGGALRFLIQDRQIVYLPAADAMDILRHRGRTPSGVGLLAIGNPTGAGLQASQTEVEAVGREMLPAQVLCGPQATKQAVLTPSAQARRYWLFSTHSHLDAQDPLLSTIQLAAITRPGGPASNGDLTLGEVIGLHLQKVDLVTLSACETALGEDNPDGTDLMSLSYVFSACTGARSSLASLWQVSDQSSQATMVTFFRELAQHKTKAAALQAAQCAVMHDPRTRHPFFWAPFILMGDWQ